MASLKQGPNLRRIFCRSKFYKELRNPVRATHRSSAGWKRFLHLVEDNVLSVLSPPLSITFKITGYTHTSDKIADKICTNYIGLSKRAIEHVRNRDPFVLKARDAFLIQKFDS